MDMPKRPNQHQLEDLSIIKFESLLPKEWLFRRKDKDYGIDGEVEIFDNNGYATGSLFFVQLKATESKDSTVQNRIYLKKETINYYRSLPLPILIVRYVKELDCIYIKWAHSIDISKIKEDNKTLSLNFYKSDLWNDEVSKKLINDVVKFMCLKQTANILPLKTYLNLNFVEIKNLYPHILKSNIRAFLKNKSNIINLTTEKDESMLIINIESDKLYIEISNIKAGCEFHLNEDFQTSYTKIINDMFLSLTIALLNFKKTIDAIKVFEILVKDDLQFINNHNVLFLIMQAYAEVGEEKKVIELYESMPTNMKDESFNIKYQTMISILSKKENNSAMYSHFALSKINEFKKLGNYELLGVAHYNYANFLRKDDKNRNYKESFSHYKKALKYNSIYQNEDYIFKEMGRVLFCLGKYKMASKCYSKGLDIKKDLDTLVLYADSLMYCGKYLESKKIFIEYFENEENIDAEWYLKEAILKVIVDYYLLKEQKRSYKKAMNCEILSNLREKNLENINYKYVIEKYDALNPFCHFNLAVKANNEKKYSEASLGFLISAIMNRNDVNSWMNCLLTTINSGDFKLTPIIITCAYNMCEETFLDALYPIFQNKNKNIESKVIKLIEEIVDRENKKRLKNEVPKFRIFDGNKFHSVKL